MNNNLNNFMQGRNGPDALGTTAGCFGAINIGVSIVFNGNDKVFSIVLGILFIVYFIFRYFSKNCVARRKENEMFLKIVKAPIKFFKKIFKLNKKGKVYEINDDPLHVITMCPNCDKKIRLPNKKGNHGVKCPICKHDFRIDI